MRLGRDGLGWDGLVWCLVCGWVEMVCGWIGLWLSRRGLVLGRNGLVWFVVEVGWAGLGRGGVVEWGGMGWLC